MCAQPGTTEERGSEKREEGRTTSIERCRMEKQRKQEEGKETKRDERKESTCRKVWMRETSARTGPSL